MIVLHGVWAGARRARGRLHLWAEDSALPAETAPKRGREPKLPRARSHPFALDAAPLADVLVTTALGDSALAGQAAEVQLVLPSTTRGPHGSPLLVRDQVPTRATSATRPRPWLVPALSFSADVSADVLRTLELDSLEASADEETTRVPVASSVRFLAAGTRLVDRMVGRGHVLPSVVDGPAGPSAVWRPVPLGDDARLLRQWAQRMPAACRSERVGDDLERPGGTEVAESVLTTLVDAGVRAALDASVTLSPRSTREASGPERAVESWLSALTGSERRFGAEGAALEELRRGLSEWQRSASVGEGPLRACFRLSEPERTGNDGGSWRVEFLLQDNVEPSLVVPASEVWAGTASAFLRRVSEPQETLLGELGRASALWPCLDQALRSSRPAALVLDTEQAHEFLRGVAPLLVEAGFGVLLPSWWGSPSRQLGAKLSASTPNPGAVTSSSPAGMDAIVEYRWNLALGDEPLTESELEELARLKAPLVRLRGQWVELDQERVSAGLRMMRESTAGQTTAGDVLAIALGTRDAGEGLPPAGVEANGWLGELLDGGAERRLAPVPAPEGFAANLRPYQQRGLSWLSFLGDLGLGAVLADDMGLGKTIQVLALEVRDRAEPRPPTLLVCPTSLVGNWRREAQRFAPGLRVHVHHGSERARGEEFRAAVADSDVVVTTYALVTRDAEDLAAIGWRRVVVDEAQNIKNSAAKQARAVRALEAQHRVALTGTPVENRLSELWSIMDFANRGLLGTLDAFRERFAVPIERHDSQEATNALRKATGAFVLRRVKTDPEIVPDLPEKNEMTTHCTLTAEQASLYQAVVDDMLAHIAETEGMQRKGLVLATMAKLKQVCNHPAHLLKDGSRVAGRSGKLARLEGILDEVVADGDRALCFTQFTEFAQLLRGHLVDRFGCEVPYLHGGVPQKERDAMVRRFQSGEGPAIFLLSLRAGGTGLNLTAANHVIHVDRWWNPAVEDQATDRAFRIGQRKDVQVRKLTCVGTVEERIEEMIEQKKALAETAVSAGEDWITELSTSQLRDLVALSDDAVTE